jgi:hypothetical protein
MLKNSLHFIICNAICFENCANSPLSYRTTCRPLVRLTPSPATSFSQQQWSVQSWTVYTSSVVSCPSETSVDNYFTRQYIPEDNSEHHTRRRENLKSHLNYIFIVSSDKGTGWFTNKNCRHAAQVSFWLFARNIFESWTTNQMKWSVLYLL